MDIKIKGKDGKRPNVGEIGGLLGNFWNRNYKFFFAIFLVSVLGVGGFFWYESLYKPAWSDQERETYRITKDRGVNFREKDFSSALSIIEERKEMYTQEQPIFQDIFREY